MAMRAAAALAALASVVCAGNERGEVMVSEEGGKFASSSGKCAATPGSPSSWGHAYMGGSVEPLEFYTSMFSAQFPCDPLPVVVAEPEDACMEPLIDVKGKAVLVSRQGCSFATKAQLLANAGASAMVLANQVDNTLFAMPDTDIEPGPLTTHNTIVSVMVRHRTMQIIKHHLQSAPNSRILFVGEFSSDGLGYDLRACGACSEAKNGDAVSDTVRASMTKVFRGGRLHASPHKDRLLALAQDAERLTVDFLVGYVGGALPILDVARLVLPEEDNEDGCDAFTAQVPPGSFLLLKRGTCTFGEKLGNAYRAGAWGVVVENTDSEIILPGISETEMDAFSISFNKGSLLASPIVFQRGGRLLRHKVAATNDPVWIRFEPTNLSIQDLKKLDTSIDELAFWLSGSADHVVSEQDLAELVQQLGLSGDGEAKLRAHFASRG